MDYICSLKMDSIKYFHINDICGIKDEPRLRLRMLPVGGVFSCLGMPGA